MKIIHEILLTFDVEDFIGDNSIKALRAILQMLEKYELTGLFFITGHMAEKLQRFPLILDLLRTHEIGYHSSSHSVRPTIFEFTDVDDYEEAYRISLERETAHINPISGRVEGIGGIKSVRDLFPAKKITAYRAPGFCWSPPHLEALRDLGVKFDFSSNLSLTRVYHKGITFYPYPILQWQRTISEQNILFWLSLLRYEITVLCLHPHFFVNQHSWDSIYWNGNPKDLIKPHSRRPEEIKSLFYKFNLLLKQVKSLEKTALIGVESSLAEAKEKLTAEQVNVQKCYETSLQWSKKFFNFEPKFLRHHFFSFFSF